MIVIDNGNVDIFYLIIRGQRQNNQLDDRHSNDHCHNGPVAEDLPELFLQQKFDGPHDKRILKLLRLMKSMNRAIPAKISVSFHIALRPRPLIMMSFTMI